MKTVVLVHIKTTMSRSDLNRTVTIFAIVDNNFVDK